MPDRLTKQGYDPKTGKDRVGQEIDLRESGKLTPKNSATVEGAVLRTAPNFNRASIPTGPIGQFKRDQELVDEDGNDSLPKSESKKLRMAAKKAVDSIGSPESHKEPRSNTTKSDMDMDHLK